jgi:hypothetical protein
MRPIYFLTGGRDWGVIVSSVGAVDFPVVVAEVVSGPVTLAVHKSVLTGLLGVGAVDTLQ